MKKIIYFAVLLVFTACKPTEANYRKAYEAAKAHTDQTGVIEGTVYEAIRSKGISGGIVTDGDTIPLITVPVKLSAALDVPPTVTRYNVALAQFKQRFNAKSLMSRVQHLGFENATIVQNAEPLYYVIVPGANTTDEAILLFRDVVRVSDSIQLRAPYPLVLTPSGKL